MRKGQKIWWRNLIGGTISAVANSGSGYLGVNTAHAMGVDVPSLNAKSFLVLLATSGVASIFVYLRATPLPPENDTVFVVKETKIQEQVSPTVVKEIKVQETSKIHAAEPPPEPDKPTEEKG
jgi:hypothetical protein